MNQCRWHDISPVTLLEGAVEMDVPVSLERLVSMVDRKAVASFEAIKDAFVRTESPQGLCSVAMHSFCDSPPLSLCCLLSFSAASDAVNDTKVGNDFNDSTSDDFWAKAISASKDLLEDPNFPKDIGKRWRKFDKDGDAYCWELTWVELGDEGDLYSFGMGGTGGGASQRLPKWWKVEERGSLLT